MNNLTLIIALILSFNVFGQEFEVEERGMTAVLKEENKSKSELFANINKWISITYNSSNDVIQLNDKESGAIIIKGINTVTYKNYMKELYPRNKYIQGSVTQTFNHLIEINIKDEKYRVIYKVTNVENDVQGIMMSLIDLRGSNEDRLYLYEELFKANAKGGVSKKKMEEMIVCQKKGLKEMNDILILNVKSTIHSLRSFVKQELEEDW
ncbi:DUF4468 domain-containing protein [Lutimonas saemankumensis]|uniref:DUF4468 domain-containing protein n=1 Tax=Lutimonas saemankumensis TaxID=483016 RepID=UPI001CD5BF2A|nr:DUF4468 domain-containing protein [Lutimonas saemankumensis]MCA0933096.1 DUF4468 domain-containing protein [Lutimonas saemankumensis]